jgi:hypothetical protein
MKIEKIYPETLKRLLVEILETSPKFSYIDGIQPFLMLFDDKEYYVYVKNLSSAYFTNSPKITRAQLPKRDEFEEIKKSSNPFIFLGYDPDNDVLVCWDFHIAKARLNEKENVSFYSRQFFQDEVSLGVFLHKRLKNNDELVLFKRKDLIDFFNRLETFFPAVEFSDEIRTTQFNPSKLQNEDEIGDEKLIVSNGKLLKITDNTLIDQLKPLIETKHTFEALKLVENFYKERFPLMTLRDWSALVKNIDFEESILETTGNTVTEPQAPYLTTPKHEDHLDNEKRKSHILKVTYPDGQIVAERVVYKTMIDVIKNAGVSNVQALGIFVNKINLISETVLSRYEMSQKPIGNGLYVMTNCDTNTKQRIIEQISEAFSMGLKVEKVSIL